MVILDGRQHKQDTGNCRKIMRQSERSKKSNKADKSDNDKSLGNLLTMAEAASYLRISKTTMHRIIREQKIGHVKIGSRILIPSKSINTFLEKHYVAPFDAEIVARRILEGRIRL